MLRSTPRIGVLYLMDVDREIRQLVEGNDRIFYKVNEARHRVEVLLIWHAARQEPNF